MCRAGGKTLALAGALGGRGRLLAMDIYPKKLQELSRRARRAGSRIFRPRRSKTASCQKAWNWDVFLGCWSTPLAPVWGHCGETPRPGIAWTAEEVATFPARQVGLLATYAPLVSEGGRLIYATCSLARVENDGVIEQFLAARADFELVPVKEIWGKARAEKVGDGNVLRLLPDTHGTDGFFAAVLRRKSV